MDFSDDNSSSSSHDMSPNLNNPQKQNGLQNDTYEDENDDYNDNNIDSNAAQNDDTHFGENDHMEEPSNDLNYENDEALYGENENGESTNVNGDDDENKNDDYTSDNSRDSVNKNTNYAIDDDENEKEYKDDEQVDEEDVNNINNDENNNNDLEKGENDDNKGYDENDIKSPEGGSNRDEGSDGDDMSDIGLKGLGEEVLNANSSEDEDFVPKSKKRNFPIDSDDEEAPDTVAREKRSKIIDSDDEEENDDGDKNFNETNKQLFGSDDEDVDDKKKNEDENDEKNIEDEDEDDKKKDEDEDESDKEKNLFGSDVDDIDEDEDEAANKKKHRRAGDSDEEDDDAGGKEQSKKTEEAEAVDTQDEKIVHEIFGMSDEEDNFEGFNEEEEKRHKKDKKKVKSVERVSDDSDDDDGAGNRGGFVSDFVQMMENKKASKKRRFRKGEGEYVNDSDDVVDDMLNKMREALQKDIESNKEKKPAYQVIKLLPYVKNMLLRVDLHQAMIDLGILSHITEWLAPLPDNSLPHLEVRETLLKQLIDFTTISTEGLKMSGLGKAVMYLFKHPKENRRNKEICHNLINRWAKPLFNQSDNIRLTREEREQRDKELVTGGSQLETTRRESDVTLRPGDPGFIIRARVPQPSNMDYVNRPRWNVEDRSTDGPSKKKENKLQKYQRVLKSGIKS